MAARLGQTLSSICLYRPSIDFYRGAIAHSIGPAISLPSVLSAFLLSPHTPLEAMEAGHTRKAPAAASRCFAAPASTPRAPPLSSSAAREPPRSLAANAEKSCAAGLAWNAARVSPRREICNLAASSAQSPPLLHFCKTPHASMCTRRIFLALRQRLFAAPAQIDGVP